MKVSKLTDSKGKCLSYFYLLPCDHCDRCPGVQLQLHERACSNALQHLHFLACLRPPEVADHRSGYRSQIRPWS